MKMVGRKVRSVSIVTQGVYDEQNGVHTLRYTEQDEESGDWGGMFGSEYPMVFERVD